MNRESIVVIRTGRMEDAKEILAIQREVIAEQVYLVTAPEEFNKTEAEQGAWIKSLLESDRETLLVAETKGKVVGWIVFQSQRRLRLAHSGSFGMMIQKEYRGRGIGRLLLGELLKWAEANPFIEKVSLGVFSTNHRAIALYHSMGFSEEGRKINEIKLSDREYADDILMYKLV